MNSHGVTLARSDSGWWAVIPPESTKWRTFEYATRERGLEELERMVRWVKNMEARA